MDKCVICLEQVAQLFETGKDGEYACFKCQPLVPEVTIGAAPKTEQVDSVMKVAQNDVRSHAEAEVVDQNTLYTELICGICQKTFQKNSQLQAHLRNHRAERRYVCTYCNKAFSQSNNLRAHLRIHTNERPYKCNECGKAFTQVTNLNNHVRLHTGERPFVCPEPGCNKAYAQVTNLNQHRKRHLNGRPVESTYDCNVCGEQFLQRNHMFNHRRAAHGDVSKAPSRSPPAPAKRLVCKPCDLTFSTERLLKEHRAQHTDDENNSELRCVFASCGAVLADARAHTEHLLQRHQLRVLAASQGQPSRRGRPPKVHKSEDDEEGEGDPLAMEGDDEEIPTIPVKIINADQFRVVSKLKLQSMFQ